MVKYDLLSDNYQGFLLQVRLLMSQVQEKSLYQSSYCSVANRLLLLTSHG